MKTFEELKAIYLKATADLLNYRIEHFPRHSFVHVEGVGVGVVVMADNCPPHKVPVLVESGNVWCYEMSTLTPSRARNAGYSLRKIWLTRKGYKLLLNRYRRHPLP